MAVPYYGDYAEDATIYIPLNAFSSDDPSASVTVTNLANTDVHIHKNGGTTQRNNAAGVTVSIDFDAITGNHLITIDTSDNTVADFWVAGAEYQVRVEGVTIDGATVNAWIGAFSIERAGGALALLKNATYGLSAIESLVDDIGAAGAGLTAIPWNAAWDAEVQSECADALNAYDPPTNAEFELRSLPSADYVVVSDLGTVQTADHTASVASILEDTGTTLEGHLTGIKGATFNGATDSLEAVRNQGDAAWATATGFSTHSAADVKTEIEAAGSHLALILADTGTDGVVVAAGSKTGYSLAADQSAVTVGTVTTLTGHTAQTGDSFARLGAPVGVSISADVAAVKSDSAAILTDTGTTLDGKLDDLLEALVYQQRITEANGNTAIYSSADALLGSVAAAFTSDGVTTIRKKLVI